jgi:phage terminase large subunit-like protein
VKEATEHIVTLKRPHAKQAMFIDSPAKRKIIRAGRRSGKTTAAAILAVKRFLAGHRVLYAVPVSDQLEHFWREVKNALAGLLDERVLTKNETEHFIEQPGTEARIRGKTAWNADTLRGDYADLLILDEWQLMDETAWGEVGAPMLLDNDGDALFIYTPPSRQSRSVSKARDPRHAAKMFKLAQADKSGRWLALHFTSHDNPHISEVALAEISRDMTQLAIRQEILAEDIEEVPGALWKLQQIDETRVNEAPELKRVVVAIDPSVTSKETSDEAGIIVAGIGKNNHGYILADLSRRDSPRGWASAAVNAYHTHQADRIVAEQNQGGEMVELTLKIVDENVSYKAVSASRGKATRAEPIAALYEQGRVHHVGNFEKLEEEMVSWIPGNPSPNRMDALVWALTELMLHPAFGLFEYWKEEAEKVKRGEDSRAMRPAADRALEIGQEQKLTSGSKVFGEEKGPDRRPGRTFNLPKRLQPGPCPQCGAALAVRGEVRVCNVCGYNERQAISEVVNISKGG